MQSNGMPVPSSYLSQLPAVASFNAQDLLARGEFMVKGVPYLASAYNMRSPNNEFVAYNSSANYYVAEQFIANATANPSTVPQNYWDRLECHGTDGWMGYAVYCNGLPASTQEFTLEFIYHLEGVPVVTSSSVPTSSPSPAGSTSTVERVLTGLHSANDYFSLGGRMFNAMAPIASTASILYGRYGPGRGRRNVEWVD
jgi:hypothetical protein